MVRRLVMYLGLFTIYSCLNSQILGDGTKTLLSTYKNKKYFSSKIYGMIDRNYFYKEIDYYMADGNYKKLREFGKSKIDVNIQFYDNGCLRFLQYKNSNPKISGRRGIIYLRNNSLKIDTQFSDQGGHLSKGTYSVQVVGDKLYLLDNNMLFPQPEYSCTVYEKSEKIPEDWQKHKADW